MSLAGASRSGDPRPPPDLARARARYEFLRLLLIVLLVLIVLGSLVLGLLQSRKIESLVKQNQTAAQAAKAQAEQVADLLERRKVEDATRDKVVSDAVARIAAAQKSALAAHDRRMEDLLRRTLGLVDAEVNAPANQEGRFVVINPPPRRVFIGPRAPGTTTPKPAPAPCKTIGKSGRCAK